jgi:hypothetical protein
MADRRAASGPVLVPAPASSPYTLAVLGADGAPVPTYAHRGRYYLLGDAGQRYIIRVTNPTDRRVEAVVSVDGLDVIDGQPADFRRKRGYVVPARGELRIEGFRVSTQGVAAFRFSSVGQSYAGRRGLARNVGVIGMAVFEERAQPEVVMPVPVPRPYPHPHHRRHWTGPQPEASADSAGETAPRSKGKAEPSARHGGGGNLSAPSAGGRAPVTAQQDGATCCGESPSSRPGLGTEYGEYRNSGVSWTRFERAHPHRPNALAELRYNDADGLRALGIAITPPYNYGELDLRETANPFPLSGFAPPPPGHYEHVRYR